MKVCQKCGSAISQEDKFCKCCGEKIFHSNSEGKRGKGCFKVFLWIFFFPIMLTIHAIKRKKLGWVIASVFAWLLTIAFFISYSSFVNSPEYILSSTQTAEYLAPSKTAQAETKTAAKTDAVATVEISPTGESTLFVFQRNTPPALISIETMPGIESWKADAFFKEFSALTGYAIPEAHAGEEGYVRGELNADNGICETDYHVTENNDGRVAEAFFNIDSDCPSSWLGEIAGLTATGMGYQKDLVDFVNSFDKQSAIENIYGDGWYKVDTGGNGDTVQLIIQHFQYDDYLAKSSDP